MAYLRLTATEENMNQPIGFIVEGHGEHNCYASLFCRIVDSNGFKVPIVNAGGCGGIVRRIKEQLNDLLLADKPLTVIITVDLCDVLDQRLASSHEEMIENINIQIEEWLVQAQTNTRLHPLPVRIKCVAQIRKFESWLISDVNGLKLANLVLESALQIEDTASFLKPDSWLQTNLLVSGCVKEPYIAKKIISAIRPSAMRLNNSSFNEFYDECVNAYGRWSEQFVEP